MGFLKQIKNTEAIRESEPIIKKKIVPFTFVTKIPPIRFPIIELD